MALHLKSTGIDFTDFGDTGSGMNSELLDDYEEGTWLPANAHISITNNYTAHYLKVGRLVTVWCDCTWNSTPADSSHSGGYISGLPFDAENTPSNKTICIEWWSNATTGARKDLGNFTCRVQTGTDLNFHGRVQEHIMTRAQVASTNVIITASYEASS